MAGIGIYTLARCQDDPEDAVEDGARAPEDNGPVADPDMEEVVAASSPDEDSGSSSADSCEPVQDEPDNKSDESDSSAVEAERNGDGGDASSSSSQSSLLRAPTLVLGQSPKAEPVSDSEAGDESPQSTSSSEEEEEVEEEAWPDSQVSSGWLGKAYSLYRRRDEKEEARQAKRKISKTLQDLKGDLRIEVGEHPSMPDYLAYCKEQLGHYGESAHASLTSRDGFMTWLRSQKGQTQERGSVVVCFGCLFSASSILGVSRGGSVDHAVWEESVQTIAKPLNRALSVMNMKQTLDDDQTSFSMPQSKRPKLAAAVELALQNGPERAVPPQSVACKQSFSKALSCFMLQLFFGGESWVHVCPQRQQRLFVCWQVLFNCCNSFDKFPHTAFMYSFQKNEAMHRPLHLHETLYKSLDNILSLVILRHRRWLL